MLQKTILVVDDEPSNLSLVEGTLRNENYRLVFATNGKEALDVAERERPDLVLLDIMMPEMDGFAVLEHWGENGRLASMRVIVLTALSDKGSVLRGLRLGAVDYLQKPFNPEELIARISNHVQLISAEQSLEVMDSLLEGARWWVIEPLRDVFREVRGTSHEKKVEHSLRQVTKRIGQGRMYLKLQRIQFDKQPVDVRRMLIDLVTDGKRSKYLDKRILDRFTGDPVVMADEEHLVEVFRVLWENAQKRTPAYKKIKVELSGSEDEGMVNIGIVDKGKPIPDHEVPLVFSLFPEGKKVGSKGRTTNLALALVRIIIEEHSGEIYCSTHESQTHFVVRLPLRQG